MNELTNKRIVVTGASSGIGRAVSILCAAQGAQVILIGRNSEELDATATLMVTQPEIHICDLSIESAIENMVSKLSDIDGLAHCAGIVQPFPIKYIKSKHILDLLTINLFSGILLCSNLLRKKALNSGASIVFVSSVSAQHPYTGGALYSVSKAGLEAFARSFALENATKKMRANIVSPALVKTKIYDDTKAAFDKEALQQLEDQYPLGIGEPNDVAQSIVFLLSNQSKWITGSTLQMDGGLLLNSKK